MAQIKISALPTGTPNADIEIPATNPLDNATPTGKTFKYYFTDIVRFILNAEGFYTYDSCIVATTAALTAAYNNGALGVGATLTNSGAQAPLAIDGVTLSVGDRVLVKNQVDTTQNGIYTVTTVGTLATNWVMTRATDYDQGAEIVYLGVLMINQGSTNKGLIYQEQSEGPFVIGTSAITFGTLQVSSVTQRQVQISAFNFAIATGADDAFYVNLLPDVSSLTDGLLVTMNTGAFTNLTSTPTLQVNTCAAKTIDFNGVPLEPGDLEIGGTYVLVYNQGTDTFNLTNPSISLPNTRSLQYNQYNAGIDSGVADAYAINLTPPITSLTGFISVLVRIAHNNTGASTLTVDGITKSIVTGSNTALIGGELKLGQVALFLYSSAYDAFVLVNPAVASVPFGGTGNTSVGASGTIAQSDGSKYTFTTATYPSTATATGTILRADGTNWVATTATYPATTTINDILYSSANNVVDQISATVGGVLVSNNTSVPSMLANPGDNYRVLMSQNAAIPLWSTAAYPRTADGNGTILQSNGTNFVNTQATYPYSTNKNHILYSSANNTVGELGTAQNAVLVSDNQQTPQWSSSLTDGQIIIGKTNDLPAAANLTAGTNISITNAANSITIASTGGTVSSGLQNQLAWYAVNGSTVSGLTTANNGLLVTSAGGVPSIGNSVGADISVNTVNIGLGAGSIATNTRVGVSALASNTTGARNTVQGYQALTTASTANDVTAVGYQALTLATNSNSTAVGSSAMAAVTSGSGTAVGKSALGALTTGTFNVAMGTNASAAITTVNDTTAVGYQALLLNTVANNTAIGSGAMDACTSGTGVAVGKDALGALTTGTNNTAVGLLASRSLTVGSQNTAVGSNALNANTASDCTAVGANAGLACINNFNTAVGSQALRAAAGPDNTAIGYGALVAATSTANTAVGSQALVALTSGNYNTSLGAFSGAAITTAADSTAIGYSALNKNTVANNTAVGSNAMLNCTTGTGAALGKDALKALTTGGNNTAVGTSALASITTSGSSTAVGHQCLTSTTGASNSGLGDRAGLFLSTGTSNVLIGASCGYSLTTATGNVGVGASSLQNVQTGGSNTAVGASALQSTGNSAAASNTAIGYLSLYTTTGSYNIAVGESSGRIGATGAVALTSGTYNSFLGYQASSNAADTIGTIAVGANAVAEKATGATSADNGPGIAIGSASYKVGFRGDGTIYDTAGSSAGYWRIKINGTFYKILLCADA